MAERKQLFKLSDGTAAYLEMNSIHEILKDKGLTSGGDVQMFHTQNVLRRIVKYIPYDSGMTIRSMIAQTNIQKPRIVLNTPYVDFLFNGQLSTVVSIRQKRRKGKKLDDWEREYYLQHKAEVDLKPHYTAEEKAEQERLKKLLGE